VLAIARRNPNGCPEEPLRTLGAVFTIEQERPRVACAKAEEHRRERNV